MPNTPPTIPPFSPSPTAYIWQEIADHLELRIRAGRRLDHPAGALPPGARLAGERELAEEYGVALGTSRRAVQELRRRGLVVTLPSKGTFVLDERGETVEE
jgi:DNA-binding GntR family transcriptional regulator